MKSYGRHNSLRQLKKYLNYELSTSVLFFMSFFAGLFIILSLIAALIFTPYMLYVLFKEKRMGWISFFFILVIIPLLILLIVSFTIEFMMPLLLVPLGLFYFYCFLLRFEVNGWIREFDAKQQLILEKQKREEELNHFMQQVNK